MGQSIQVASSTSMMSKNSKATSVTSTSFLVLLLSLHVSSIPLPSNIFFPDTVVCLTTTTTPQDFNLADPNNCRVFWQCRWDGSTSVHTAVMGECLESEVFSQGAGCVKGVCRAEGKSILFGTTNL